MTWKNLDLSWNSPKILAENSQINEMTNYTGIPPQPVRWVSVLSPRVTSLFCSEWSSVWSCHSFGTNEEECRHSNDRCRFFVNLSHCRMVLRVCVLTLDTICLIFCPLGGATGHWEDLSQWTWCLTSTLITVWEYSAGGAVKTFLMHAASYVHIFWVSEQFDGRQKIKLMASRTMFWQDFYAILLEMFHYCS